MANALAKVDGLPYFTDLYGHALDMGDVFIGQPNTDPRQNPMTVYYDEAQTIPAAQPLKVLSGRITKTGSVAEIFLNPPYSIYVQDQRGAQVYYLPSVDDPVVAAVGALTALVVPNIAALRLVDVTKNSTFNVTSYYATSGVPDGGGGTYKYDASDTTSVDNGGTIVVTTSGARLKLQWFNSVSVLQFGVKADAGTTDNSTTLAAAVAWVASGTSRNKLTFPSGIYGYSVSPNFAIQNAVFEAEGEVRLRYSGTGHGVILDAGSLNTNNLYNITMTGFIVEMPPTGKHAVFIRGCHHSNFRFKPRSAGTTFNGIEVEYAVCTAFPNCTVTPNEDGGFYLNSNPQNGVHLTARNAGEQTSYCKFDNPIMEALNLANGAGFLLESTIGNQIYGGTSEGGTFGILTGPTSAWNKVFGHDMEVNTNSDIFEQGTSNEYHTCDTGTLVTVSGVANWPMFFAGNHKQVTSSLGSRFPTFAKMKYNREAGGGFTNNEPSTILDSNLDLQAQKIGPFAQGAVAVPGSGLPYTNVTGNRQTVAVFGGTLTSVTITRNGTTQGVDVSTRNWLLEPQDAITVSYSVAPTSMYTWQQ